MKVIVYPIDAPSVIHEGVDRISYINSESFGTHEKIGGKIERGESVLVVSVQNVSHVRIGS